MIWIIAILLLLICGVLGFFKGALQMLVSLVGFFVALLSASSLAPMLTPLFVKMEYSNLMALKVLPLITAFLVVSLIFSIIGFLVHWKVFARIRFSMDEVTRLRWTRMNQHCGAVMGLFMAAGYTILIGMMTYVAGYASTQVASSSDEGWIARLNAVAGGLEGSGMARIARSIATASETFYQASDLLALAHDNPLLEVRFRNYPPFLKLGEDKLVQDLAADDAFNTLWTSQASLGEFLQNPACQQVMADQGFIDRMLSHDLEDLGAYLRSGESPKFKDESILGRWEFDANATINHFMRNTVGVTGKQIRQLKEVAYGTDGGLTMVAYPDGAASVSADAKRIFKNRIKQEIKQRYGTDAASAELYVSQLDSILDGDGGNQGGNDGYGDPYGGMNQAEYDMQQRYGLNPGATAQRQGPSASQVADMIKESQKQFEDFFSGLNIQWKRVGRGRYEASGSQVTIKKDYRLMLESDGLFKAAFGALGDGNTLIFKRVW